MVSDGLYRETRIEMNQRFNLVQVAAIMDYHMARYRDETATLDLNVRGEHPWQTPFAVASWVLDDIEISETDHNLLMRAIRNTDDSRSARSAARAIRRAENAGNALKAASLLLHPYFDSPHDITRITNYMQANSAWFADAIAALGLTPQDGRNEHS